MVLLRARPEMRYLRYAISTNSEPSRLAKGTGIPLAKNPGGGGLEDWVGVCFVFIVSVLDAVSVCKVNLRMMGLVRLFPCIQFDIQTTKNLRHKQPSQSALVPVEQVQVEHL